jgi:SAM-dependent methyltransferase
MKKAIKAGRDPLGEAFTSLRSASQRRPLGAVYTPAAIVDAMISWAKREGAPARIVDPGCGSGRFLMAAARAFPKAELVGVELDPLAALVARANAVAGGYASRLTLRLADYRAVKLAACDGQTLFVGNPPYVRHHAIDPKWKHWFSQGARARGIKASQLAGLHLHFFLRTLQLGKPGDYGLFITSAEWLDVNYGSALRELLADGLGGTTLDILDPRALAFEDVATTAAITSFRIGRRPAEFRVRAASSAEDLAQIGTGAPIPWTVMSTARRWSTIIAPPTVPAGHIELGELFRVHRGAVTGANVVWIEGEHTRGLPDAYLLPTITRARELIEASPLLRSPQHLKRVLDLPVDLGEIDPAYRRALNRFLKWAEAYGAKDSYIAQHRRAWWSVCLREPAPIIVTYMARRPPCFVRNLAGARHLNIAHGLYPREPIAESLVKKIIAELNRTVRMESGRTYAGGLTKFEPREIERLTIPAPENLV